MILQVLLAMLTGWIQRHQQQVITYLQEENRVLKTQLGGRRLHLIDTERRRLAALAHPIGRTRLKEIATMATLDGSALHVMLAKRFRATVDPKRFPRPRRSTASDGHQRYVSTVSVSQVQEKWPHPQRQTEPSMP
jgi:hypothetical protein